jgi:hypothetical protein
MADLSKRLGIEAGSIHEREQFLFKTTHRDVWFIVCGADISEKGPIAPGRWVRADRLAALPFSSPQRRILGLS